MENGKQPIYPIFNSDGFISNTELVQTKNGAIGLTKREYFAGLAMQGLLANPIVIDTRDFTKLDWVSYRAVNIADEILKQLEK